MQNLLSLIKDAFDAFQVAYKYAELDFYKLRGEVVSLLDKARTKGYGNPDYCEITINVMNSFETDVTIQSFYRKENGRFYRFKKDLDLGKLSNIPYVVSNRMKTDKEVSIRLTDFQTLYSIREEEINPSGDFNRLHIFTFRDAKGSPVRKEMSIKDELFYYVVKCTYVYENGERETRTKYYGTIINLPQDIIDKIESDDDKECVLDVTNP